MEAAHPQQALIVDTVGSPEHGPEVVRFACRHGWRVYVLMASLPTEEAIRRVKLRALASGRVVDPLFVEHSAGRPERWLRACLQTEGVRGYAIIDTTLPNERAPIVIESDSAETFGRRGESVAYW